MKKWFRRKWFLLKLNTEEWWLHTQFNTLYWWYDHQKQQQLQNREEHYQAAWEFGVQLSAWQNHKWWALQHVLDDRYRQSQEYWDLVEPTLHTEFVEVL